MNPEEAKYLLGIESTDELEDKYEEFLFEFKQFVVTRFPIGKLINSKTDKYIRLAQACAVLGYQLESTIEPSPLPSFEMDMLNSYAAYHQTSGVLRKDMLASACVSDCARLAQVYLKLTKEFAKVWTQGVDWSIDEYLSISTAPDPMLILEEIRVKNEHGIHFAKDLDNKPDDKLVEETKRLSLWLQKEG